MSAQTKILVVKMKQIIYTVIFTVLAIIFIILLALIISGKAHQKNIDSKSTYSPGIYQTSLSLSSYPVELEVVVDSEQIKSIDLINLSDSVATMYPLIESSLEDITKQVKEKNTTEGLTFDDDNKYTSIVLVNAINKALNKARN